MLTQVGWILCTTGMIKSIYVDSKLIGSYINGSQAAMDILQKSSARYYQRPDANYLKYDSSRTNFSGYGGGN